MESCVPHSQRTIRTNCHVLWPYQLSCHISNDDEYNILIRHSKRGYISLHGQYHNPYKEMDQWNTWATFGTAPKTCPWNIGQIRGQWPLSEAGEMCLQTRRNWVPWHNRWKRAAPYGSEETQRSCRLSATAKPYRCLHIPWTVQLLLILHPLVLRDHLTIARSHKEIRKVALGWTTIQGLQNSQNSDVHGTSPKTTQLWKEILPSNWRIGIWCGSHTLTRGRDSYHFCTLKTTKTCTPSNHLLFSHVHSGWTKLWHLWEGATSCDESALTLATILRMDQRTLHHHDRSHKSSVLEVP